MFDTTAQVSTDVPTEPNEAGFTLIELLVVLLLMGVLMAIAVPTYLETRVALIDPLTRENRDP